jgi:site-specific DNA-methyltransferase (adenine-specific)
MTIELLNIDCMEYMATQPDDAFDLAIVDPPYGIGIDGQKKDSRKKGSGKYHASKWTRKQHDFKGWDSEPPSSEYFNELIRVSKNQIIWGGNYFIKNLYPIKGWVFWYKGQNDLTMSDGELAWTSFNKPTRQFTLNRMALTIEGTIHPTQKPIKLYKWLLDRYAEPKHKILDTHLGSGSSAIAAHYFGCDFVGCEIDTDYFNAAKARFDAETRQVAMF